jgi:hypothetical protein
MLTYHPAHDPYHSALRMLRILAHDPVQTRTREQLQILDFYLTFPELIADIRLPPKETRHRNAFRKRRNEYNFSGDPRMIFRQMQQLQDAALRLLISTGVITETPTGYSLDVSKLTPAMQEVLTLDHDEDHYALNYVTMTLGALPVTGKDGLKARTGLMEFKYDAA